MVREDMMPEPRWDKRIRGGFYAADIIAIIYGLREKSGLKVKFIENELLKLKEALEVIGVNERSRSMIEYFLKRIKEKYQPTEQDSIIDSSYYRNLGIT